MMCFLCDYLMLHTVCTTSAYCLRHKRYIIEEDIDAVLNHPKMMEKPKWCYKEDGERNIKAPCFNVINVEQIKGLQSYIHHSTGWCILLAGGGCNEI